METAEAIMENENNSNLESESNLRDRENINQETVGPSHVSVEGSTANEEVPLQIHTSTHQDAEILTGSKKSEDCSDNTEDSVLENPDSRSTVNDRYNISSQNNRLKESSKKEYKGTAVKADDDDSFDSEGPQHDNRSINKVCTEERSVPYTSTVDDLQDYEEFIGENENSQLSDEQNSSLPLKEKGQLSLALEKDNSQLFEESQSHSQDQHLPTPELSHTYALEEYKIEGEMMDRSVPSNFESDSDGVEHSNHSALLSQETNQMDDDNFSLDNPDEESPTETKGVKDYVNQQVEVTDTEETLTSSVSESTVDDTLLQKQAENPVKVINQQDPGIANSEKELEIERDMDDEVALLDDGVDGDGSSRKEKEKDSTEIERDMDDEVALLDDGVDDDGSSRKENEKDSTVEKDLLRDDEYSDITNDQPEAVPKASKAEVTGDPPESSSSVVDKVLVEKLPINVLENQISECTSTENLAKISNTEEPILDDADEVKRQNTIQEDNPAITFSVTGNASTNKVNQQGLNKREDILTSSIPELKKDAVSGSETHTVLDLGWEERKMYLGTEIQDVDGLASSKRMLDKMPLEEWMDTSEEIDKNSVHGHTTPQLVTTEMYDRTMAHINEGSNGMSFSNDQNKNNADCETLLQSTEPLPNGTMNDVRIADIKTEAEDNSLPNFSVQAIEATIQDSPNIIAPVLSETPVLFSVRTDDAMVKSPSIPVDKTEISKSTRIFEEASSDNVNVTEKESESTASENVSKEGISTENAINDIASLAYIGGANSQGEEGEDCCTEIPQIKKEIITSDIDRSLSDSASTLSIKNIKQEPARFGSDEDEVVVLDDDGEMMPVKKEAVEQKATENGLGIQISEVSGQQHQLHANAEINPVAATDSKEIKTEARKSKSKSKIQTCIVCKKICRCKYNIVRNGDVKHLCDDACFKQFRKKPSSFLKTKEGDLSEPATTIAKPTAADDKPSGDGKSGVSPAGSAAGVYKTCAVCQLMNVNTQQPYCNWKGLDFCGESCLGKFQANLNTTCSFCFAYIPMDMRATFCLKIGNDMRPFCKQKCYNEFKKKLRLCAFCQRDLAAIPTAFSAMAGEGKFKEFCSQACLDKLKEQVVDVEIISVDKGTVSSESITCSVCHLKGSMKHTVKYRGKTTKLCSDLCLTAFQYSNKINVCKCDSCGSICTAEEAQAHFVQYEGKVKRFCSDHCVNQFRKDNSKVVMCGWCATKKLNFDMIERLEGDKCQMFCSLNCLSLYRVNLQAKSNQAVKCDQCLSVVPAQYHLTMSDASVRNFCSYQCVMTFQSQFAANRSAPTLVPSLSGQQQTPSPQQNQQQTKGGSGKRGRKQILMPKQSQAPSSAFPVISNVISLAQGEVSQQNTSGKGLLSTQTPATGNVVPAGDGKQQILIQAPAPKTVRNKSLQCRPIMQTKATSCRPHSSSVGVQTDEIRPKSVIVPIPVPVYIPMPTVMFTAPTPKPVAFPIPIPVPIFIPTTRKSANGILKTIKEIAERMPADPLEAELLMMAEAVAADKKPGDSDTDSEADAGVDDFAPPVGDDEEEIQPVPKQEDMIEMAMRMAEEMSGPIEDLESNVEPVAVQTELPGQHPQAQAHIQPYTTQVDDNYIPPTRGTRGRGAKRASRGRPPASRPKRQRIEKNVTEEDSLHAQSQVAQSMEPPPDSNYRLKFTYGVNAWRHWVINKNVQIEKSKQNTGSCHRARTFPTDILKCTTDELNFTLCMFISEVRKPNGGEYSPDSIFYLCLGIQQYLYENGRIDNIFTDLYFEKFTDSLHRILKTLQPKVNTQGQMLCRIEEEHLWESKQLGAHSPYVLLNTLIYFHTKHFILKTAQEHMSLSFAQILKHWKKGMPVKGQASSSKNVSLRFYCLANGKKDGLAAKKNKEGVPVYEVTENFDNPLRCPVKLYEFFLSKCPESIKNRNDIFYPVPERSCVPDSPVWYSTQSIDIHTMDKMLTRILLVREIQESHLHAQPIYL